MQALFNEIFSIFASTRHDYNGKEIIPRPLPKTENHILKSLLSHPTLNTKYKNIYFPKLVFFILKQNFFQ